MRTVVGSDTPALVTLTLLPLFSLRTEMGTSAGSVISITTFPRIDSLTSCCCCCCSSSFIAGPSGTSLSSMERSRTTSTSESSSTSSSTSTSIFMASASSSCLPMARRSHRSLASRVTLSFASLATAIVAMRCCRRRIFSTVDSPAWLSSEPTEASSKALLAPTSTPEPFTESSSVLSCS